MTMTEGRRTSFGVYDRVRSGLAYIGLHDDEADVWRTFLGWPGEAEIADAKVRGFEVLPLTVQYKPSVNNGRQKVE